jgi:hypothetical protein
MNKSLRFGLVLSPAEKAALRSLANRERLSAAAVVRRLIWHEAKRLNIATDPELAVEMTTESTLVDVSCCGTCSSRGLGATTMNATTDLRFHARLEFLVASLLDIVEMMNGQYAPEGEEIFHGRLLDCSEDREPGDNWLYRLDVTVLGSPEVGGRIRLDFTPLTHSDFPNQPVLVKMICVCDPSVEGYALELLSELGERCPPLRRELCRRRLTGNREPSITIDPAASHTGGGQ